MLLFLFVVNVIFKIFKIIVVLALLGAMIFIGPAFFSYWPELQRSFESDNQEPAEKARSEQAANIDGALLLERFEAAQQYQPPPEEIAEDQAYELE